MYLKEFQNLALFICLVVSATLAGCLQAEVSGSSAAIEEPIVTNAAPSISGSPVSAILIGDTYLFTPTASDPDGDALVFSVQNLPFWATFDESNGSVSGTPLLGDIGSFLNIVISVSDGNGSASLPAFSIDVAQIANASMLISWTAPTENTDGTPLMNLAGYRIYYGLSEGDYPNMTEVGTAGTTSFVVENLLPGTYYVVATSINVDGAESPRSAFAIKTAS